MTRRPRSHCVDGGGAKWGNECILARSLHMAEAHGLDGCTLHNKGVANDNRLCFYSLLPACRGGRGEQTGRV